MNVDIKLKLRNEKIIQVNKIDKDFDHDKDIFMITIPFSIVQCSIKMLPLYPLKILRAIYSKI